MSRLRRLASLLPVLTPVPPALFPVSVALAIHAAVLAPPPLIVVRSVCVVTALVLLLCISLIARGLTPGVAGAGVSAGVGLVVFYGVVHRFAGTLHPLWSRALALGFLALSAVVGWRVIRRSRANASRADAFFNVLAVSLSIAMLLQAWLTYARHRGSDGAPGSDLLSGAIVVNPSVPRPDVYHIVLDGLGRPDVLKARYGVDLSDVVGALKDRGFEVSERIGLANYVQTSLSLPSMLNAAYIDAPADPETSSLDRSAQMFQGSSVVRAFKRLGYQFHYIGSDYLMTSSHPLADVCECDYPLVAEFESTVLDATILRATGLAGIDHRGHRNQIRQAFSSIESTPHSDLPRFLLAHIMSPHPPFVFDARGEDVFPSRLFSLHDGSGFRGSQSEYERGYREQARYIATRLVQVLDRLTERSRAQGHDPIVIVHGDHGPRYTWHMRDARRTDPSEALPVFLAVRWSGGRGPDVAPNSLVNVYRALFHRYFDADLRPLPDRGFLTSARRPYEFVEVDIASLDQRPH